MYPAWLQCHPPDPDSAGSCLGIPGLSLLLPARLVTRTWDMCDNSFPELRLAIARLIPPRSPSGPARWTWGLQVRLPPPAWYLQ